MRQAVVRDVNGQVVIDDPQAIEMARAVAKFNCRKTLMDHADAVKRFALRIADRNMPTEAAIIVLLNVDDPIGGPLAGVLMPDYDWSEIRARGETPFARGIVMLDGIQAMLDDAEPDLGAKLRGLGGHLAVLVMDHGVAEVFEAAEVIA